MLIAFLTSLALLGYTYFGYPLLLRLMARGRTDPPPPPLPDPVPRVSVIVTAHNEENAIADKIANVLALEYPSDRLELVVASDASTDRTDAIVAEWADRGVRLARLDRRGGKVAASRAAVAVATGSILVFSDATGRLDPSGLKALVARFAEPTVGAVTGHVVLEAAPGVAPGEGQQVYWSYNN
ncbi:MAG TPA: glycosyltransferase, partial [Acidimicrobiia bacterium]|nr:glycosyltransferase [Acidimicrobiia bacterium]